MMRLALLALLALLPAQAERVVVAQRHSKSWRGTIDGFPLLVLRGNATERGFAHGKLAGKDVVKVLEGVVSTVQRRQPGSWSAAFIPAARRFHWPARFEQELSALLEGLKAALPDPRDRTLPSLSREPVLDDLKALNALSDILGTGCSSFSAWGRRTADGKTLTARNADYGLFPILEQVALVAVEPSEKGLQATLELTILANVGASTALNADGAFLALHDEAGLAGSKAGGWTPRTIALREAVEKARGDAAPDDVAGALRKSAVKVGNNVHVSGRSGVPAVLEWDGAAKDSGVTVRPGTDDLLVCTNHYQARADRGAGGESQGRAAALREEADRRGRIDFDGAKAMLDRVAKSGAVVTYFSVVVWPAQKRYAFALSPALGTSSTRGRWIVADWADLFKP